MNSPDHATHFADQAVYQKVEILRNEPIARDTYLLRLALRKAWESFVPGQFIMLRLPVASDPLLARAFAVYDLIGSPEEQVEAIDIVYVTLGKMTSLLARRRVGESLEFWGPLGNGFARPECDRLLLVAGGIGQTPLLPLVRQMPDEVQVTLCYEARTADLVSCMDDFLELGVEVYVATDDGSFGHQGLVVDLMDARLTELPPGVSCEVVSCGPRRMMQAVAARALAADLPCQLSLETPMACGIGICSTCAVKVRLPDGGWDYKRACVDGPVFYASELVWD